MAFKVLPVCALLVFILAPDTWALESGDDGDGAQSYLPVHHHLHPNRTEPPYLDVANNIKIAQEAQARLLQLEAAIQATDDAMAKISLGQINDIKNHLADSINRLKNIGPKSLPQEPLWCANDVRHFATQINFLDMDLHKYPKVVKFELVGNGQKFIDTAQAQLDKLKQANRTLSSLDAIPGQLTKLKDLLNRLRNFTLVGIQDDDKEDQLIALEREFEGTAQQVRTTLSQDEDDFDIYNDLVKAAQTLIAKAKQLEEVAKTKNKAEYVPILESEIAHINFIITQLGQTKSSLAFEYYEQLLYDSESSLKNVMHGIDNKVQ